MLDYSDDEISFISLSSILDIDCINRFECGKPIIDNFLRNEAVEINSKNIARTTLLYNCTKNELIGFFTLGTAVLEFVNNVNGASLPERSEGDMRFQFPVIDLSFIGVDRKYQNNRFGTLLMNEIFTKVGIMGSHVAYTHLAVDSLWDCTEFYEKSGFNYWKYDPEEIETFIEKFPMVIDYWSIVNSIEFENYNPIDI